MTGPDRTRHLTIGKFVLVILVAAAILLATPLAMGGGSDSIEKSRYEISQSGLGQIENGADRCGTIENLSVSDLTLSVGVENGSVDGLRVAGDETNATVDNGSVLLDNARVLVNSAMLTSDGIVIESDALTVQSGGFFVQNGTANERGISLQNRRFTPQDDDGVRVTGVGGIRSPPDRLLANSSMDKLSIREFSGPLEFSSASSSVLGVVRLQMEDVELSERPLNPTFEALTVRNGSVKASEVSVPVEDASLSIGDLEVLTPGLRTESESIDTNIRDQTARFSDIALRERGVTTLLERAC